MIKFFRCRHCGNVIEKMVDSGVPVVCCGEKMEELTANTVEAATEKHLPIVENKGKKIFVKVGQVANPMIEEHYINFIALESKNGVEIRYLHQGEAPEATFAIESAVAVYGYCNLHGLWKTEVR